MAIVVLGIGKTGRSLANYFESQGETVWGIDDHPPEGGELPFAEIFSGVKLPDFSKVSRFFISPGVDPRHQAAQAALRAGIRLEGELDLAFSLCQGEVLAITGTNGKSTTTALLGEMLKNAGLEAGVGGNLGTPFLNLVLDKTTYTHYVVEVSSFQLETIQVFRPRVATLLNLSDDHLDRHSNMTEYLQAKRRIFDFQESTDFAVYNDDDLHVLEAVEGIVPKKIPFSTAKKVKGSYGNETEVHWAPEPKVEVTFSLKNCALKGLHNLENIAAAIANAKLIDLPNTAIQKTLDQFQGLPHRIQWVGELNEVQFYDDSKATNVGATVMSLASFDQDVLLILGGVDKGGDYAPLKPLLKAKARGALVLGEAKEKILKELEGATELIPVANMKEAVQKAFELAPPGGTVLLAPACSSFDMYQDYKERGEDFQKCVAQLKDEPNQRAP